MPEQLYNPGSDIIKAYMEGVRAKREKEQSILEKQKLDQQKAEFDANLKEHTRQFDATQSIQKALHEAQMAEHSMNIQQGMMKMQESSASSGLTPPGASESQSLPPGQDPISMLNGITGSSPINRGIMPGQEMVAPQINRDITLSNGTKYSVPSMFDYAKQQAQRATILAQPAINTKIAEAKGIAEATLPSKITLETLKDQKANDLEDKKAAAQMAIAKMNNAGRISAANIGAAARKYAADHQKSGVDPEEITNVAQLNATGQAPLPSGNNGVHVESVLRSQGMVPIDKSTQDKINSLGSLPLLFKDLENFANKNLSDNKGFGPFGTSINSKIPQSEIANDMASIRVNAGPIARIFEGQTGRLTMQQINLAMDAMTSGSITKTEALSRINELKKKADSKLYNEILAGVPPKQQEMIVTSKGLPYSFQNSSKSKVDELVQKHGGR